MPPEYDAAKHHSGQLILPEVGFRLKQVQALALDLCVFFGNQLRLVVGRGVHAADTGGPPRHRPRVQGPPAARGGVVTPVMTGGQYLRGYTLQSPSALTQVRETLALTLSQRN